MNTQHRELGVTQRGWKLIQKAIDQSKSYDPSKVSVTLHDIIMWTNSDIYKAYRELGFTGLKKYSDVVRIVKTLKEAS
jgi:hypothetical protein